MNQVLEEIYRTRVVTDSADNEYPLSSHVDADEGAYLAELISSDTAIVSTLEVGCAFGLSSLFISEAIRGRPDAHHTIIDPSQFTVWHGVGVANLDRAGLDFYDLIPEPSEVALPSLLREGRTFDLVFIDGFHTFDQTVLDLFYANRLTRVGGYVVVDDCTYKSVSMAVAHVANYPCFSVVKGPVLRRPRWRHKVAHAASVVLRPALARSILPASLYWNVYQRIRFPRMVALKKVRDDDRNYAWFEGF